MVNREQRRVIISRVPGVDEEMLQISQRFPGKRRGKNQKDLRKHEITQLKETGLQMLCCNGCTVLLNYLLPNSISLSVIYF